MFRIPPCLPALACLLTLASAQLQAQDSSDAMATLRQTFLDAAKQIRFSTAEAATNFRLIDDPLLNWSNPVRTTPGGALFLWVQDKRPVVAMCKFSNGINVIASEFQSLSDRQFTMQIDGKTHWRPAKPGVEMRPVPMTNTGNATIASTASARLRQMRSIAREFSAELVPSNRNPTQLRMMSSPAYRYENAGGSGEILDGALFLFSLGTDPEVMLVIETLPDPSGTQRWHYGIARMSVVPSLVHYNDTVVWQTQTAQAKNPSSTYFLINESQPDDAVIEIFE
ncbi:hypothetical protein NHH03_12950 [Stieleria sp. TO1_6]|uniref:hypothetical protein n=1 Tax=Stieleria tagensis TaxID=2956795 RepID=UPI00209B0EEF|nr:hypothetical protein [Stieleria tagensis]MCO8122648.1 hypothetical protein [Stieleria tagensis]